MDAGEIISALATSPMAQNNSQEKESWDSGEIKKGKVSNTLEGLYLSGRLLDWAQTRKIARNPDQYSEKNPFLGPAPSQEKVDAYMALLGTGHYFANKNLPDKLAIPLQILTIAEVANAVNKNRKLGLGMNKPAMAGGALLTYLLNRSGDNSKKSSVDFVSPEGAPGLAYTRRW